MTSGGPSRRDEHLPSPAKKNPYDGESLQTYPDWWRENIEEFREHGMLPYRPPRFEDGVHVTPIIQELETRYDLDISLQALNPTPGSAWQLSVDGHKVRSLPRQRTEKGYTLYEISSEEFVDAVLTAVDETQDSR